MNDWSIRIDGRSTDREKGPKREITNIGREFLWCGAYLRGVIGKCLPFNWACFS